ncbi:UNVERIFIED_CONTAM: Dehydrin DHN1 [Sesamum radiatum]|uniref:Dehydrin DHN1 n=1 Tax=Sesamum radiatum TaxID=300843 RepID=A0AAW2RG91_SESRA
MAQYGDQYGRQTDEYGNPIRQTDEYGNPVHHRPGGTEQHGTTGAYGTDQYGTTGTTGAYGTHGGGIGHGTLMQA